MKFWQKAYFCIIIFFLIAFDITSYLIVEKSYEMNKSNEISTSENEYYILAKSISDRLESVSKYFVTLNKENIHQYIKPYADYYMYQNIFIETYIEDQLAFSNFDHNPLSYKDLAPKTTSTIIQYKYLNDKPYLCISDSFKVSDSNITFVYIKDESKLVITYNEIKDYTLKISLMISSILSFLLIIMLLGLTHPIRKLNKGAKEITKGNYHQRVLIKGNDEIGEFASNFNKMADHVEEKIDRLLEVSEEKQRFIDNFSHEMRTPTAAIIGYGELLKNADISEEQRVCAINYIIDQGTRLQNLSLKLLELSSMKHGTYDMKIISIKEILNRVQLSLSDFYIEKAIHIQLHIGYDAIYGDEDLLESLFQNLLENSIKALEHNGCIDIYSDKTKQGVCVTITDDGPGIGLQDIPFVLEPFYRVDKSRSRKHGGTGLGLSICKNICDIHNAKLDFESKDSGTIVKVLFTDT